MPCAVDTCTLLDMNSRYLEVAHDNADILLGHYVFPIYLLPNNAQQFTFPGLLVEISYPRVT